MIVEKTEWAGRTMVAQWHPGGLEPPRNLCTQASGICFVETGQILLVRSADRQWALPGGHPELGEQLTQALRREVWEEACARVVRERYIGCVEVDDPQNPQGETKHYAARFWARVELADWHPLHETTGRILVEPGQFVETLAWDTRRLAVALLEVGLAMEHAAKA